MSGRLLKLVKTFNKIVQRTLTNCEKSVCKEKLILGLVYAFFAHFIKCLFLQLEQCLLTHWSFAFTDDANEVQSLSWPIACVNVAFFFFILQRMAS